MEHMTPTRRCTGWLLCRQPLSLLQSAWTLLPLWQDRGRRRLQTERVGDCQVPAGAAAAAASLGSEESLRRLTVALLAAELAAAAQQGLADAAGDAAAAAELKRRAVSAP